MKRVLSAAQMMPQACLQLNVSLFEKVSLMERLNAVILIMRGA
jgi:hypothetical protein